MTLNRLIGLMLLLGVNSLSFAAPANYFVHLKAKNRSERSKVANLIHIDTMVEDSLYSVVNAHDFKMIKKRLPKMLVESHIIPQRESRSDVIEFPSGDEKFHTYQEVVDEIKTLNQKFPDITELFVAGKSTEGKELVGIRITGKENRDNRLYIPGILFTGAHHAREHLSTEVPMLLINHLLSNYQNNAEIHELINNRDIYIIPIVNPDGKTHDIKGRNYKLWRKNRRVNNNGEFGVDLNRNYSHGWGTGGSSTSTSSDVYMGPSAFSEPETQAIRNFVEEHSNIKTLLTFHTFSELILYPWGGKYDGVGGADEEIFKKMATTMSKWNGYTPEQASDLYIASGDTCDWAYGEHGIYCFTFELSPKNTFGSAGFYPGAKIIDSTFKANVNPALYLIKNTADPAGVLHQ